MSVWLAPTADETAALAALEALEDSRGVRIAESPRPAIAVLVVGPPVAAVDRLAREAELRADALRALREAGVPRAGAG